MTTHDTLRLRPEDADLELGPPVAVQGTPDDVLRYAALGAEPGSTDRLEASLVAAAVSVTGVPPSARTTSYEPPREDRPFALSTVETDGEGPLTIARGEPRAVVERLVRPTASAQARAILANARVEVGRYQPLAVAVRRGDGPWTLLGYVPVRAWTDPGRRPGRPFDYRMVWDIWLRIAHWGWVASIVVLTVTGYFIADPGWVPSAWTGGRTVDYFMGYVRLIHLLAAVLLILVLVLRVWNLSTSKIAYDRWKALIPFRSRAELRNLWLTARAYAFVRREEAPEYFGHNPLQQLTYSSMYVLFLVQVTTGLALWGLYDPQRVFWGVFAPLTELLGVQGTRLLHFAVMWMIIMFLPAHVYLSIRADSVERSGAISSMVSGGRWIRRGARFEDWPPRRPHGEQVDGSEQAQQ